MNSTNLKYKAGKYVFRAGWKRIIQSILFVLTPFCLHAQTEPSAEQDSSNATTYYDASAARTEYFTGNSFFNFGKIDTGLREFQKFNPARKQLFEYSYLSNYGAPYYPRYFEFERTTGFDYGRHERDLYLFGMDELPYYRTNIPFTEFAYILGSHSEQYLHALHTRNFGPSGNVAVGIDKLASEGYYQHVLNDYVNVYMTGWYTTKKDSYRIAGAVLHTENKNQENGGIIADTLFESPFPDLAEPFRTYAFTEWSSWQGQLTQMFLFGHEEPGLIDSTTSGYRGREFSIEHQLGVHKYDYLFEDLYDQALYGNDGTGGDTLRDLSSVSGFYNRVAFGNNISDTDSTRHQLNWLLKGVQQYHIISDQSGNDTISNLLAGGNIDGAFTLARYQFSFSAGASFDFLWNAYDVSAKAGVGNTFIQLSVSGAAKQLEPTYIQHTYNGFHFSWKNDFEQVKVLQGNVELQVPSFGTSVCFTATTLSNYIAFIADSDSGFAYHYPVQYDNSLQVLQVWLAQNFILGPFHFNNRVAFQQLPAMQPGEHVSRIELPEWITQHSWYFEKKIFDGHLFTQMGFDIWYASSWYGYKYNLIDGQFGLQAGSEEENYTLLKFDPVVDVFFNFDIRTFRFFVKCDNVSQGLFSKGYFEAPQYPMQPRGIKLGIDWQLFY